MASSQLPVELSAKSHPENNVESTHTPDAASPDKSEERKEKEFKKDESNDKGTEMKEEKEQKQPEGGYDSTPLPHAPPGYTLRFTFHRAANLPMADINSLSSDPYVLATLTTTLPTRHKEDPPLTFRTPTIRRSTDPEWNQQWIVANVPASGFRLKCRIYDEDPADHDDRLGNSTIEVDSLSEHWAGIDNESFKIKKRMGSKRAYLMRAMAVCIRTAHHMHGHLFLSVEMLGRTETEDGSRAYTIGPMWWTRHYSPLLGRLTGLKEDGEESETKQSEKKVQSYNFQANQFQLHGPPPPELYHRYVEFKSFVKGMFTASGISGFLLSKALHHQHAQVYNFDRKTEFGQFDGPSKESTLKFLDLVHYANGGRIYTYIMTLDSLFRFTETGKEFGIDFLSKHTMHSDVSIYIAYSGEFFVRRVKDERSDPEKHGDHDESHHESHAENKISEEAPKDEAPKDPKDYELVIDNDSGTYRPNADLLPKLKQFLEYNLPGLSILTLDCQKDAERQQRMKAEQRKKKEKEGNRLIFRQMSRGSSVSSSDVSELNAMDPEGASKSHGFIGKIKQEALAKKRSQQDHLRGIKHDKEGPSAHGAAESTSTPTAVDSSTTEQAKIVNGHGSEGQAASK